MSTLGGLLLHNNKAHGLDQGCLFLQFFIHFKEQIKSNNFRYSKDRMRMHYKVFGLCQGYLFDPWNTCDRGELNLAHNAIFWYIQNMLQCYTDTYNTCYELYKYIQNMLQATKIHIKHATSYINR